MGMERRVWNESWQKGDRIPDSSSSHLLASGDTLPTGQFHLVDILFIELKVIMN